MSLHVALAGPRAALAVLLATLPVTPALASGPFAGMAGNWRGTGTINMTDGGHERVRCKGTYAVRPDNQAMSIDLLCASDSYKVNIISNVQANGSGFSGQWQETTRQVQGDVSGSFPGPGQLRASLEGTGFGMQFASTLSGNRQALVLKTQGTGVDSVDITLAR